MNTELNIRYYIHEKEHKEVEGHSLLVNGDSYHKMKILNSCS